MIVKLIFSLKIAASASSGQGAQLLVDKAVQCYPDQEKYFKTEPQAFPWFQVDLQDTRVVFGLTVFFRDDAFKPPYSHFSNIEVFVLDQPLQGQITKDALNNLDEARHCYTLNSPPTPRKYKLDIECYYALEGRYIGVIMNNNAATSYISLNEVVPILHGKHIFCFLLASLRSKNFFVVCYRKAFCLCFFLRKRWWTKVRAKICYWQDYRRKPARNVQVCERKISMVGYRLW